MLAWNEPIGKAIRWPLGFIPQSADVPILSGPNRGLKWRVGSGIHGCWLGSYERRNADLLHSLCRPGMTAFDVGANAGYFTLLFSWNARPQGKVLSFEPDPSNRAMLEHHLLINAITNVSIVPSAASDRDGDARFECGASMGHLTDGGKTIVRTTCLDQFPTPDLVKMDIEGAETLALLGAKRILSERRTKWFIELHGNQANACINLLEASAYKVRNIGQNHILAEP